jgi:hypothetical protein
MMSITQAALDRELLTRNEKVNDNEQNYIGKWESYEFYDSFYEFAWHQINIRNGSTKEILSKRISQTYAWKISIKYGKLKLHTLSISLSY